MVRVALVLTALFLSAAVATPARSEPTRDERLALATERAPKGERPYVRYDESDSLVSRFLSLSLQCHSAAVDPNGKALHASMFDYMRLVSEGASGGPLTTTYELYSYRDSLTGEPVVAVRTIMYDRSGKVAFPYASYSYYSMSDFGAEYKGWSAEDLITGKRAEDPPSFVRTAHPLRSMKKKWQALCNVMLRERKRSAAAKQEDLEEK